MTDTQELKACREAFEKWAITKNLDTSSMTGKGYTSKRTSYCWSSWQAAYNLRHNETPTGATQELFERIEQKIKDYDIFDVCETLTDCKAQLTAKDAEIKRLRAGLKEISEATEIEHGMYAYCADKYVLNEAKQLLNNEG